MVKRLRKEETSVGERQDARSKEGGANRGMGEAEQEEEAEQKKKSAPGPPLVSA